MSNPTQGEFRCRHGWRGSPLADQIHDRCPACGGRSLFIGKSGYLTCSVLGCSDPGVTHAWEAKVAAAVEAEREACAQIAAISILERPAIAAAIRARGQAPSSEEGPES